MECAGKNKARIVPRLDLADTRSPVRSAVKTTRNDPGDAEGCGNCQHLAGRAAEVVADRRRDDGAANHLAPQIERLRHQPERAHCGACSRRRQATNRIADGSEHRRRQCGQYQQRGSRHPSDSEQAFTADSDDPFRAQRTADELQHTSAGTGCARTGIASTAAGLPLQAGSDVLGSVAEKVLPLPACEVIVNLPPWRSSTCLTIASPSPVPWVSRERLLSTR